MVPAEFRGRDHVAETVELLAGPAAPPLEHVRRGGRGTGRCPTPGGRPLAPLRRLSAAQPSSTATGSQARRPAPDALAQLLFTSGTSGEPKGVLHRMQSLTRAVGMEIGHLGLTRADRVFIPSPLAHQTGFLYGMWLALVAGRRADPAAGVERAGPRWRRCAAGSATFVQAATPFLADLVAAVEPRPGSGRRRCGSSWPPAPPCRARWPSGPPELLGAAVCGAWGTTETCLGTLAAPGDEPALVWGTDGRALAGVGIRVVDDDGTVLRRRAGGQLRGHQRLPVRRLPRPARPDRRGDHRRTAGTAAATWR